MNTDKLAINWQNFARVRLSVSALPKDTTSEPAGLFSTLSL